jgi:hypothetical protein
MRSTAPDGRPELAKFASGLRRLVGEAEGFRPLLCNGSPLDAVVALVGANPGTTTPFWPFWSDDAGVDKQGWLEAYRRQHGGKFGRSRAAIERFLPLVQAPVIELNAHARQSRRLAELGREHRTTEVLAYILHSVRPKVALCAGADAYRAVAALGADWPMQVLQAPHFIYWGREREERMASEVNAFL